MKEIKRFVLMLQFFTRIPIKLHLKVTEEDFGKGLIYAPFVGIVIGALLALVSYGLFYLFPKGVAAAIILVLYLMITGGLHMDGLGDTFDGLFSNRSRERMLEIMRDSRVGTNAVLAVISVILLDYAALTAIDNEYILKIILFMPMAGRIGSLTGAAVSSYARSGEGLGRSFIDYCGKKELFWGLLIYCVISFFTLDYKLWIILLLPPVSAFLWVRFFSKKIGGATGDILGAVCELNQCIFLIAACGVLA